MVNNFHRYLDDLDLNIGLNILIGKVYFDDPLHLFYFE